jgi:hypothetical protein
MFAFKRILAQVYYIFLLYYIYWSASSLTLAEGIAYSLQGGEAPASTAGVPHLDPSRGEPVLNAVILHSRTSAPTKEWVRARCGLASS